MNKDRLSELSDKLVKDKENKHSLANYSTTQLKEELRRRKKIKGGK